MRPSLHLPLILVLTLTPCLAHADEAAARAASDRADALKQEGKLAESCQFRELAAKEGADFKRKWAVGICYEEAGKTATAWMSYDAAMQFARASSSLHPNDELLKEQAKRAKVKVDDIAAKVPKLRVLVTEKVDGLTLLRGTESIAAQFWGSDIPLDPGDYTVTARAPGYQEYTTKVALTASNVASVSIPRLVCEHPAADGKCVVSDTASVPATAPASSTNSAVVAPSAAKKGGGVPAATWVLGGVGVVSLAASGIFAIIGNSDWSSSKNNCNAAANWCNSTGHSQQANATTMGTLTTVTLIAGGVLVVAGVTIWIVGGSSNEAPKTGLMLTPGGLSLVGSF